MARFWLRSVQIENVALVGEVFGMAPFERSDLINQAT